MLLKDIYQLLASDIESLILHAIKFLIKCIAGILAVISFPFIYLFDFWELFTVNRDDESKRFLKNTCTDNFFLKARKRQARRLLNCFYFIVGLMIAGALLVILGIFIGNFIREVI